MFSILEPNRTMFIIYVTLIIGLMIIGGFIYFNSNSQTLFTDTNINTPSSLSKISSLSNIGTLNIKYKPTLSLKKFRGLEKYVLEKHDTYFTDTDLIINLTINNSVWNFMVDAVANPTMQKCLKAEPYVQEDKPQFTCTNANHRDELLAILGNFTTKGFKVIKKGINRGYVDKTGNNILITIPINELDNLDLIELGESSLEYVYQNESRIAYETNWGSHFNITLYENDSGDYSLNTEGIWLRVIDGKFGANHTNMSINETRSFLYQVESDSEIIQNGWNPYIYTTINKGMVNEQERHVIVFGDICSRGFEPYNSTDPLNNLTYIVYNKSADCQFDYWINNAKYYLNVTFVSDMFIDPLIQINTFTLTNSLRTNITQENNFTHLNISDISPYNNLVGYWNFDGDVQNTTGFTSYDFTKSNLDGTAIGNTVVNTSCINGLGRCAHFDGTGDYIDLGTTSPFLDVGSGNGMSIAAWARLTDNSTYGNILHRRTSGSDYHLTWDVIAKDWMFHITTTSGNTNLFAPNTGQVEDEWVHVVGTWNSTDLNMTLYINGVAVISKLSLSGIITPNSNQAVIGRRGNSDSDYFDGQLDEIMLFNGSLSRQNVLDIYNNQSARFKTNGLQEFFNQSYLNLTGNRINVSHSNFQTNMNSNLTLKLGFVNDSVDTWSVTEEQQVSSLNMFNLSSGATNITLNYTFYAGNGTDVVTASNSFYSPLLFSGINITNFSAPAVAGDTTFPLLQIIFPTNLTNHSSNTINVNYTASDETALDSCWYSNDSMTLNITLADCGTNITGITWGEGQHNVTLWTNDTSDNVNRTSVRFFIDTVSPTIDNLANQTIEDNETLSFDIDATELTTAIDTWTVNNTGNFSINGSGYLTNTTRLKPVTLYNLLITVNDSVGNSVSGVMWVNVTNSTITVNPKIDLEILYPTDLNALQNVTQNTFFNVTVNVSCTLANCGQINVSLDPYSNQSGGFSLSATSSNNPRGIGINISSGSFWIFDGTDIEMYYVNVSGSQLKSFDTFSIGQLNGFGVGFDNSTQTIWSIDSTDLETYHYNGTGDNLADNFDFSVSGNTVPRGIAFDSNNNSFWITDDTDDFVYHYNSSGDDQTDGFETGSSGANTPGAVEFDTRDNSIWVVDTVDSFVYHFNSSGDNQTDGFDLSGAGASSPSGITFDKRDNSFWIADNSDDFVYHFSSGKNGLISSVAGNIPFYTNQSNPRNISLNQDESQLVVFWVNATGTTNINYTFFAYANLTSDLSISNISSTWNVSIDVGVVGDTTFPLLEIIFPTNLTNHSSNTINVNYTASDETALDSCWYSNDSMTLNITLADCGTNITGITLGEGQHNVTLWTNDTSDNVNRTSVRFFIDTVVPTIDNLANQTIQDNQTLSFDIDATELTTAIDTWTVNNTGNFSINASGYLTNITRLKPVTLYNLLITVNDSVGNSVSGVMWVNVTNSTPDTTYPLFTNNAPDPVSPDLYNVATTYEFAIDVSEHNKTIGIQFNGTNFTSLTDSSPTWAYDAGSLSAGLYSYYWWAYGNGSDNNFNTSVVYNYTILQQQGALNLTINGSKTNFTAEDGTANLNIFVNASFINGTGNIELYNNGVLINNGSIAPIFNVTNLSVGYYNITAIYQGNNNITSDIEFLFVNVTTPDTTPPNLTINNPANATFTTTTINFNITVLDNIAVDTAWYSLDGGTSNRTLTNIGNDWNATNTSMPQGSILINYYVNDTSNNINNSEIVSIFIDSINPIIILQPPTPNDNTNQSNDNIFINVSVNETNEQAIVFLIYNSTAQWDRREFTNNSRSFNFTSLPDDVYVFNATVNDTLGNIGETVTRTVTIDSVAPFFDNLQNITIEDNKTLEFDFNATDNTTAVSYFVINNTGNFTVNATGFLTNSTRLRVQQYNLELTVNDSVGNSRTGVFYVNVTNSTIPFVDTVNPNVTINQPLNQTYTTNLTDFNITVLDNIAVDTAWYSLDGGTSNRSMTQIGNNWNATNLTGIEEGSQIVTYYANDTTNNLNWSESVSFFVDTISPLMTFVTPTPSTNTNQSNTDIFVNVTVTETNNGTIVFIIYNSTAQYDRREFTNLTRNFNFTGLSDEVYSFNVTTNDTSGNRNETETRIVTVDSIAPFFDNLQNITLENNITLAFDFNATDNTTAVDSWVINNTGNFTINSTGFITNASQLGVRLYPFTITVNDSVGNSRTAEMWVNVTNSTIPIPDTTPPNITIEFPVNNTNSSNNNLNINYTTKDIEGLDSCWYSNDSMTLNITLANCLTNITGVTWEEGEHNVIVYVNDTSNNPNSTSVKFFIDTVAPTIDNLANQTIEDNETLSFDIDATELTTAIDTWVVNNTGNFSINGSGYLTNVTKLDIRQYNILITVNDSVGNSVSGAMWVNVTNSTIPFVDTINPNVTINQPLNQTYTTKTINFNVTVLDNVAVDSVWYTLNNGLTNRTLFKVGNNWNATNTTMNQGSRLVRYYANDTSGNINNSRSVAIFIDSIKPLISYTGGTPINNTNRSYNNIFVNVSIIDDNRRTTVFRLYNSTGLKNQSSFTTVVNNRNFTGLADGVYFFNVSVNDSVGNYNKTITRTLRIDTIAPIISNLANQTIEDNQTLSFDIDATDGGTGISYFVVNNTGNFSINGSGYLTNTTRLKPVTLYNLLITVNDSVGNSVSGEMWVNVTNSTIPFVDTINPNVTINQPQNQSYTGTVDFNVTVLDNVNVDTVWYSLDGGTSNRTLTQIGNNWNATNSSLPDLSYQVIFYANDTSNNINNSELVSFFVDSTAPIFSNLANQTILNNQSLNFDIDANDNSSLGTFTVNNTGNFSITSAGVLTNITGLNVRLYNILITVNDSLGNSRSASMWVNVTNSTIPDTTAPAWSVGTGLRNFTHTVNTSFSQTIDATDSGGIDTYTLINNTNIFNVSSSGLIQNRTNLSTIQLITFNYTVNDTSNNLLSGIFTINIVPPSAAVITGLSTDDMILGYNVDTRDNDNFDLIMGYNYEF